MEIPRLCSHGTQSHPALCLGKASCHTARQITLWVRSFALGQRHSKPQDARAGKASEIKKEQLSYLLFRKNLQFCRFFFETESKAPGPLFSLVYLPRSVITKDIYSTQEIHFSSLPFFIFEVLCLPVYGRYTLG